MLALIILLLVLLAQPANADEVRSRWMHSSNTKQGISLMILREWPNNSAMFVYEVPRDTLKAIGVHFGTVLFEGTRLSDHFEGVAYTFKGGCIPQQYLVKGNYFDGLLVLRGPAPKWEGCRVTGYDWDDHNSTLPFVFMEYIMLIRLTHTATKTY